MHSARRSASTKQTGVISRASCAGGKPRAGKMRSLEEILKSSGLNTATTKANGGSPPDAIPEPALDEGEELCARCGGARLLPQAGFPGPPPLCEGRSLAGPPPA